MTAPPAPEAIPVAFRGPGRWRVDAPLAVSVAGVELAMGARLASLTPFEGRGSCAGIRGRPELVRPARFELEGGLDVHRCALSLQLEDEHLELRVDGVASFRIDPAGLALEVTEDPRAPDELLAQAILGPALSLVLALRGVVCVHASAVELGGRALLFVGESGVGKSTLARHFRAQGWRRLADDVMPLALVGAGLMARPRFPQLRLAAGEQVLLPHELEVAAIFELAESATNERATVEPLAVRDRTLALVRHTVAARLFPPDLLSWHLGWAAAASAVPVSRLRYPRRLEVLPELERLLVGRLGQTAEGAKNRAGRSGETPGRAGARPLRESPERKQDRESLAGAGEPGGDGAT